MRNIFVALALVVTFIAGGITVNQYLRPATAAQDNEPAAVSDDSSADESSTANKSNGEKCQTYMGHKAGMGDVDHNVTNIDNGVVIEMTSTDEETVRMIQEHKANKQEHMGKHGWRHGSDLTKNVENIDNGVRVTITSDDPNTVQRLQEHKAGCMKYGDGKYHGGRWSTGKHMKEVSES